MEAARDRARVLLKRAVTFSSAVARELEPSQPRAEVFSILLKLDPHDGSSIGVFDADGRRVAWLGSPIDPLRLPEVDPAIPARFVAATRTTSFGTDVVILDAVRGTELLRVTNDERSFNPVWSPAGDSIAYFSIDGGVTDLWSATLVSTSGTPTLDGEALQLTIAAGLDASSRPGWWIPTELLPTPAPTPTSAPSESAVP